MRTRKPQARTLATRDRLLAAGREIVAERGMPGLRTEEVVLRAGTAKGTFFAHFPDRDHFLAALLADSLSVEFAEAQAPTDVGGLRALLERIYSRIAVDGEAVVLLARFSGPAGAGLGLDVMICDLIARLTEGLGAMQASGQVANKAAPEVLAEAVMALAVHAAASAQCAIGGDHVAARRRADALIAEMVDALLWPRA